MTMYVQIDQCFVNKKKEETNTFCLVYIWPHFSMYSPIFFNCYCKMCPVDFELDSLVAEFINNNGNAEPKLKACKLFTFF